MDIKLPGTLYEYEITREDLVKDEINLQAIYDYQNTITDPVIAYHMDAQWIYDAYRRAKQ